MLFFEEIAAPPLPRLAKSVHLFIRKGGAGRGGRGIRDSHKIYGGGEMCKCYREIRAPLHQS